MISLSRIPAFGALVGWLLLGVAPSLLAQTLDADALRAALGPQGEHLRVDEQGQCFLQIEGTALRVRAAPTRREPWVLEAPSGRRFTAQRSLLRSSRSASLAVVPQLLRRVPAGEAASKLSFRDDPLVGPSLWANDGVALPEGWLVERKAPAATPGEARVEQLRESVANFRESSANLGWPAVARQSLLGTLELLPEPAGGGDAIGIDPSLARAMVASGWLGELVGEEAAQPLIDAVREATRLAPHASWQAEDGQAHLKAYRDAFDSEVWVLVTRQRAGFARELPDGEYHASAPTLSLEAWVAPGQDPLGATFETIQRARVLLGSEELSAWNRSAGFRADGSTWRSEVGRPRGNGVLREAFPPHVLLVNPKGEVLGLHTAFGSVATPKSSEGEAAASFVEAAAKSLPDAAHLDLLGQHLFAYVYDSPDPTRPQLVGRDQLMGENHQTLPQTLATAAGGVCRGDCDDLAELYQVIAARQGRLAHIMELPGHAALGYAEGSDEDGWSVNVLQTGPPLHFRGNTLPETLREAYGHFETLDTFDPDQLGIALRFAGENVRSSWVLGWRIFSEPAYATAMIDVQKDWHFHTYRRAITKMMAMLEAGDRDPANLREVSGLWSRVGDHAKAAEWLRKAIEVGGDPAGQLAIQLVGELYEAERDQEAAALVADLREKRLKLEERMGPDSVRKAYLALQLAATIANVEGQGATALDILESHAVPITQSIAAQLTRLIRRGITDSPAWDNDPQILELRGLMTQTAAIARMAAEKLPRTQLGALRRLQSLDDFVGTWLAEVAFYDTDSKEDFDRQYGQLGGWLAATMGEEALFAALSNTPFPTEPLVKEEHQDRAAGLGGLARDLAWVRASRSFWAERVMHTLERDRGELDRERFDRALAGFRAARQREGLLGWTGNRLTTLTASVDTLAALIEGRQDALERSFELVAQQRDKALTDATAELLGGAARFVPADRFRAAVESFAAIVGHKPGFFTIAWTARDSEAPAHARIAAEIATRLHPDDEGFAEEARFLMEMTQGDERVNEEGR